MQHYLKAKGVLQRVLHLQPNNLEAIFDIAYCSQVHPLIGSMLIHTMPQAYCIKVMTNTSAITEHARVEEMNAAFRELQAALRTFRHLAKRSKALGWDADRVEKHVEYIEKSALPQAKVWL